MDNPDFTPSQVGGLFTFLARQLAKPDNTLFVNRKLFDQVTSQTFEGDCSFNNFPADLRSSVQVLEFLCCPDDDSRHTERQQVQVA